MDLGTRASTAEPTASQEYTRGGLAAKRRGFFLKLRFPKGELLLTARVVHSTVSRAVVGTPDVATIFYESGIEFVGIPSESLRALPRLLTGVGQTQPHAKRATGTFPASA